MIETIECDLLESNCKIRAHQVNCKGVMGSGVAACVKEKYPEAFAAYQEKCKLHGSKMLGHVQYVKCHDGTIIANMFAQNRYGHTDKRYTNYDALTKCLQNVCVTADKQKLSIAFPYLLGCDRGGGNWNTVKDFIEILFHDYYPDIKCEICKL